MRPPHIVVFLLCTTYLTCVSSFYNATLWVNQFSGRDTSDCGLSSVYTCRSLNYTLTRSLEVTNAGGIVQIFVQGVVTNEVVQFVDIDFKLGRAVISAEGMKVPIISTAFTALASVDFINVEFWNSTVIIWQSELYDSTFHTSFVQGVSVSRKGILFPSFFNISRAHFEKSHAELQSVLIYNSTFTGSPLVVLQDQCDIRYRQRMIDDMAKHSLRKSAFRGTKAASALTVKSCSVDNSIFEFNAATLGGAITATGAVRILSSLLHNNTAEDRGGAIYSSGTLFLFDTGVMNNGANIGGGIHFEGGTLMGLECEYAEISTNKATIGGGIAVYGNGSTLHAESGCTLVDNKATAQGGGLYILETIISGSGLWLFGDNQAPQGGGIFVQDSYMNLYGSFIGNEAQLGAGVFAKNSALNMSDVKFMSNVAVIGTEVELQNSSSLLGDWKGVTFLGTASNSISCDDCNGLLCPAATSCHDCIGGCIMFGRNTTCTSPHTSQFGCYGESICIQVMANHTICNCAAGFYGDLCAEKETEPFSPRFPGYAVALILIFGTLLIAIMAFVAARVYYNKKEYRRVEG